MGKKHTLTFPGRYDQIQKICTFVVAGAQEAGFDESAMFHVELACDEACTNIIEHAYGGEDVGDIVVSWQIDAHDFLITLQDNGRNFNPNNVPPPSIPTAQTDEEALQIGGLGIHFMNKLMDKVTFAFDPASGNSLQLSKKRPTHNHTLPVWHEPLENDVWLVGINGRLEQEQTSQLETELNTLLDADHRYIIVDLAQTSYINSGGLRCLVTAWRRATKQGGNLSLCALNGRLQEIFTMVGFNRVFQIYPDRQTAHQEMTGHE